MYPFGHGKRPPQLLITWTMTGQNEIQSAQAAAGRLFRAYERHCKAPDLDTLFDTLTSLHSLNDRLKKATGTDLHGLQEFVALKVLRNFAHHEEEVRANTRVIPTPAISDLLSMCIVRRDQVERAIENVDKRWRDISRSACHAQFHWYGDAVNINPALFNAVVRTYETLVALNLDLPDDDVALLRASYEFETENNHSHYVDGKVTGNIAQLSAILAQVSADLPSV